MTRNIRLLPFTLTAALAVPAASQLRPSGPIAHAAPAPAVSAEAAWSEGAARFDGLAAAEPFAESALARLPELPRPFRAGETGRRSASPARSFAFEAAGSTPPDGSGREPGPPKDPTALQKHAMFFDEDGDGVITPLETYRRLRALGFGRVLSAVSAVAIHAGLSSKTGGSWGSIPVAAVHKGMHPSDTGVYDAQGRFDSDAFELLFARFDADRSGSLSESELDAMLAAHAAERPGGETASRLEFKLLMMIASDRSKRVEGRELRAISRERLLAFYDGSLFYELAGRTPPWRRPTEKK